MVVILCLCCVYWWKKNRESSYFIIIIVVSAGSRAELAKLLLRARKEEWIGVLLSYRIGGGGGGIDDWEAANLSCTCVQPISGKWAVVTMTIIWLFVLDTSDVQRILFSPRDELAVQRSSVCSI